MLAYAALPMYDLSVTILIRQMAAQLEVLSFKLAELLYFCSLNLPGSGNDASSSFEVLQVESEYPATEQTSQLSALGPQTRRQNVNQKY